MKDWRVAEEYPLPDSTPNERWAWEFLRRNPEYQADWERALQTHREIRLPLVRKRIQGVELEPVPQDDPDFSIASEDCENRWGLLSYCNPKTDQPRYLWFKGSCVQGGELKLEDHEVAIVLDLRRPLRPQCRSRLAVAKELQRRIRDAGLVDHPKAFTSSWPRYLRVLDAKTSGATNKEIAAELFPEIEDAYPEHRGSKKVDDCFRAARKLRDNGYRDLLLRPPAK